MVLDRLDDGDEAVVIVSHGILRRAEILDSLIDRNLNLMLTIMDEAHNPLLGEYCSCNVVIPSIQSHESSIDVTLSIGNVFPKIPILPAITD